MVVRSEIMNEYIKYIARVENDFINLINIYSKDSCSHQLIKKVFIYTNEKIGDKELAFEILSELIKYINIDETIIETFNESLKEPEDIYLFLSINDNLRGNDIPRVLIDLIRAKVKLLFGKESDSFIFGIDDWKVLSPNYLIRNIDKIYNRERHNVGNLCEKMEEGNGLSPFEIYSIYKWLENKNINIPVILLDKLIGSLNYSLGNLKRDNKRTFIASDASGSMNELVDEKGSLSYADIVNLIYGFDETLFRKATLSYFCEDIVIFRKPFSKDMVETLKSNKSYLKIGYKTEISVVFDYLIKNHINVERIVIFTDKDIHKKEYLNLLKKYKEIVNRDVFLYVFNLSGQNSLKTLHEENIFSIKGWNENYLKLFDLFENSVILNSLFSGV